MKEREGDGAYFNLFDYFLGDRRLSDIGDRIAIVWRGEEITYNRLRDETDLWTERLLSKGVGVGDRAGILLADSPEFIAAFLAAVRIGAIAVLINTFLTAQETEFILKDSGAKLLITEPSLDAKASGDLQAILVDREGRRSVMTGGADPWQLFTTGQTPA
ncbi:MAG TPA: AMP-binding protein, partial [Blastocatellia bacterium]